MSVTVGSKGRAACVVNDQNTAAAVGSEVTAVDGRKLTFAVTAYDEAGPIGKGTHERFIIQNDKFLAKAQGKKKGN